MLPFFLVFVGITLFVNGVSLRAGHLAHTSQEFNPRDVGVVNIFTGLMGMVLLSIAVARSTITDESLAPAAYMGLFVLTYFWLGINSFTGASGRAFGWFSLLVPFVGIPVGIQTFMQADSGFMVWLGFSWFAWSILWFMFFLLMALDKPIGRITGTTTAWQGVLTAFMPAILHFWEVI